MYKTKTILEEDIRNLRAENSRLRLNVDHLIDKIKLYDQLVKQPVVSMTIALEKISDATAHTITDMKRRSYGN